jgi:hypothetical protein
VMDLSLAADYRRIIEIIELAFPIESLRSLPLQSLIAGFFPLFPLRPFIY